MADKRLRKTLKKLIFNDKYLIIVSLFLAVIVWIVTSINIGDVEEKTIKIDVPIKLGDEISDQLSMQYYSLQDTVELSVTFSGAKYVIGQVGENDFSVKFDTSDVSRTGDQRIPILVSNNSNLDFTVTSVYPSSVEAYFDVNLTKTFDLNLEYDEKNVADGYTFGEPVLSEDKIVVSGPKTFVEQIENAVLNVDFGSSKDLTEPFKTECAIEFEGIGYEASYLSVTSRTDTENQLSNIAVTLPVLKVKTLPVSVQLEDAPDGVDEGLISITYSKDSIEAGVLDSADISGAVIGTLDFTKISTGKNTFDFDVTNLKGITVLDKDLKTITATVNVSSSYELKTIGIKRSDVLVEGLSDSQKASVRNLSKYYVTVIAPKDVSASSLELELKVDVSEKSEDNSYPLTVTITNNDNAWVYSTYTATVDIT